MKAKKEGLFDQEKWQCYGCYQNFDELKSRSSLKTLEKIQQLKEFLHDFRKTQI